ncbi:PDR/VanB family oxidoreductase [Pandoraea apista]|uniref:Vanillate O-demethylase oxidoreductase n=1 Tax=Pandoraea apista TaxID=93218 RepID=A0A0B5FEH3_9BURK|nr:PDR/VanB family oxidoreductase [Pandoraea apista]AJE98442.1 Vanillate O-demethylase oxidoreductase [Pandoraea apista]AKH72498.1 Vanillate O-demethylase oxidoreductase [Pandoraea apista]AKI60886.1 Vanillate O-demethylase oxidoreductase [Pandoraea apista]ALS66066.1 oxidoreductase [Pandoraea apista]AVF39064.1 oxidoreductase [Pandoraea apista]
MKVRLANKRDVATDICEFELVSVDGSALPAFTAGAHIDVHVADGLVRQYSLCNAPGETHRYCLGVLRDPASRGGSEGMHALTVGTTLEISAPRNHFPLDEQAQHSILLAGGIGVTPILCMAEALSARNASFEVHYCTREPARTAFRERFARDDLAAKTRLYFDSDGERADLDAILAQPSGSKHLYVCGPAGFIEAVLARAEAAQWPEGNVHREYFAAPAQADTGGDTPFQVKLHSSGRVIDVKAGETIVAALAAQGVEVQMSCEQGVCGTCLTRVIDGTPDHRDVYLTDDERAANDQILPCCSRSKSAVLVLDL